MSDKKTENIGLHLTPLSSGDKTFQEFRMELAGDEASNMIIIDREIAALKALLASYKGGAITWGMLKDGFSAKVDETE
jgi:hypothetical protein